MFEVFGLAIIVVLLLLGTIIALRGSRPLLGWYLREVRGIKTAQAPDEAIVTYPMA